MTTACQLQTADTVKCVRSITNTALISSGISDGKKLEPVASTAFISEGFTHQSGRFYLRGRECFVQLEPNENGSLTIAFYLPENESKNEISSETQDRIKAVVTTISRSDPSVEVADEITLVH